MQRVSNDDASASASSGGGDDSTHQQRPSSLDVHCAPLSDDCGLEVRASRIPNAGSGLFATRAFAQGSVVCEYTGEVLASAVAWKLADKSYLMKLGNGKYVDARQRPDVLARYINDCRGRLGGFNVTFDKQPQHARALVIALRDLRAGDELFVDYGRFYWLAYNLMHPESPVK